MDNRDKQIKLITRAGNTAHNTQKDMEINRYAWLLKVVDHSEPELKISYIDLYGLTEGEAVAKVHEIKNKSLQCKLYRLYVVI